MTSKSITPALARELRFAEALSETTHGIVLVMDPHGRISHANSFLAELGGYQTAQELIGLDWFETFIPERERAEIRELFSRACEGEPIVRHRNPVVDRLGVEHEIQWSGRRLLGPRGELIGLLSVGLDVTETELAHRSLQRQRDRFAKVIASTQDAFVLIDKDARITGFNVAAETIFGHAAEEVLGKNVSMLMPDPYHSAHDGYILRYEQTGEARAIGRIRTVEGVRKSGEVFPIELSVTRIEDDAEASYAAFIRDVTETVRLRTKVVERERLVAIGVTSAKFAHEVGNPLNGMLMNLQLARRRIDKGASVERLVPIIDRVEQEVRRLAALLHEFRSMSRRQTLMLRPLTVHSLLADFVRDHGDEYASRGVTLTFACPEGLPVVDADRQKLTQVLLNLAKNAVEAMGEQGGRLTLRAHADEVHVGIDIEDDAGGIPEDIDVFEPFVTTKSEGTGLGLSVVRQIVAAHGGELDYDSRPGEGTTFHVRLPLHAPSASHNALAIVDRAGNPA